MTSIKSDLQDGVGTIVLDQDERRNVLGAALAGEIGAALADFEARGARAVVLRANPGVRVWSAGHDVDELPQGAQDPLQWADPLRSLVREIESFPAPVIAFVEGSVWGGACEVVFACDLSVAVAGATFAATPARVGVPYNATGLLTYLNAAPLRIAKEMLFTAAPLAVERLEALGVVNRVLPVAEAEACCNELAAAIANNAPLAVSVMKEQLRILSGARALSPYDFERIQGLRRVVYSSEDYAEGRRAIAEKRKPVFRGE